MPKDFVLEEAKRLHALGFAILWLHPKSKRPVGEKWAAGPRKDWKELVKTYVPGFNVGVRLGTPSKIGSGYLAAIDVDVKSTDPRHKREALEAVRKLIDTAASPCVRSGRGNGSRHYYGLVGVPFKTVTPFKSHEIVRVHIPSRRPSRKEIETLTAAELESGLRLSAAWEVSLYSDNRQVVLPPSIHPDSEKPYRWVNEKQIFPTFKFPAAILNPPEKETTKKVLEDFEVEEVELAWLPLSKSMLAAIVDGTGVEDRSAFLMKASTALLSAGLTRNEVLTVLTDPKYYLGAVGYEHAQTKSRKRAAAWVFKYTFAKVEAERTDTSVFESIPLPAAKLTEEEAAKQAADVEGTVPWQQTLDKTKEGKLRSSLKNLDIILSNKVDPNLFEEDIFASCVRYGVDVPWGVKAKTFLEDKDRIRVKRWFADALGFEPSQDMISEATTLIADRKQVHPVRDWLKTLTWDGVPRVATWLKDYCNAKAKEPYLSEISRKFFSAMVHRVFEPGCQWDYVLILESTQGVKKSSIARAIAGDDWFMDNLPDLRDKDSMLSLQGKWLIELGELANIKRADFNQVKAYLSRRKDRVRPHYGRLQKDIPRQSVFIGTVNEGQYLKDPTGNRRYWPVKVGQIDVAGFLEVREQIFAEAYAQYVSKDKELLYLSPEAEKQARRAQDERRVDDDELEMKEALLSFIRSDKGEAFHWEKFRTKDLFYGVDPPWGVFAQKGYALNIAASVLIGLGCTRFKSSGVRFWKLEDASK